MAVHFDSSLLHDKMFCAIFPQLQAHSAREIKNESQLTFALMTTQGNETMLLHEGEYDLKDFVAFTNLQVVGLGQRVVLSCTEKCEIVHFCCSFENIVFPQQNIALICEGK